MNSFDLFRLECHLLTVHSVCPTQISPLQLSTGGTKRIKYPRHVCKGGVGRQPVHWEEGVVHLRFNKNSQKTNLFHQQKKQNENYLETVSVNCTFYRPQCVLFEKCWDKVTLMCTARVRMEGRSGIFQTTYASFI